MKQKIGKLKKLKVKSFLTSLENLDTQTVKGGNQSAWCPPPTGTCPTNAGCGTNVPTSTVNEEVCPRTIWDPGQCNF